MFKIFKSKKSKAGNKTPAFSSKDTFLSDRSRTTGDLETHSFSPPLACVEHSFYFTDTDANEQHLSTINSNSADILNEEAIRGLLEKYPLTTHAMHKEEFKETPGSNEVFSSSVRLIRQSLNLIKRYNNSRKQEERQGFASTLSDRAEEIGAKNTIHFLLDAIDKRLVRAAITIGARCGYHKVAYAAAFNSHRQTHSNRERRLRQSHQSPSPRCTATIGGSNTGDKYGGGGGVGKYSGTAN